MLCCVKEIFGCNSWEDTSLGFGIVMVHDHQLSALSPEKGRKGRKKIIRGMGEGGDTVMIRQVAFASQDLVTHVAHITLDLACHAAHGFASLFGCRICQAGCRERNGLQQFLGLTSGTKEDSQGAAYSHYFDCHRKRHLAIRMQKKVEGL